MELSSTFSTQASKPSHAPTFFFLISSLPGLKKDWYHLIIFQCCTLVMTATCSHKANQRVLPFPETSMTARKWEGVATKLHGEEGVLLELHPHHSASSNSIEIAHLLQGWRAALLLGWGLTCPPASVQTLGYFDFAWKSGFLFRFLTMLCIWGLQNPTSGHFTQCYFLNERKNSRPLTLQLNFFPSPEPKWLRAWQIQGWSQHLHLWHGDGATVLSSKGCCKVMRATEEITFSHPNLCLSSELRDGQ